jgi:Tol biopolymer transport system component
MRMLIVGTALAASALNAQDPAIFAPGVISGPANELSPAFAPDCHTVWFTVGNSKESVIAVSRFAHGRWSTPTTADFSGRWRDLEPAMAPDGSFMIFASSRPITDGGPLIDGSWGGSPHPGRGGNLWRVDRRGNGWSAPVRLPEAINSSTSVFSPSVVADGSLYFMKASPETGRFQIYRSQYANGQYQAAERVSFSDEQWGNVDPAVAPDESFAVFSSNRPPTADKDNDLFIVFRKNGAWDTPVSLGARVNSPSSEIEARLAPDHRTLFFSSNRVLETPSGSTIDLGRIRTWNNGQMHIWSVDLSSWLPPAPAADGRACTVPS